MVGSIVRALPSVESGRALLELRNDWDSPVRVIGVHVGSGATLPLLNSTIELAPGRGREIDVSEKLRSLFNQEISEPQEKRVQIHLHLDPEPPKQPAPSTYQLTFEKGHFIQFSS